jgi:2-dehydro-3-deoxyphosphooctonate aldolase (KDO 8-P synthase)
MIYILGPCVIESEHHAFHLAYEINRICAQKKVKWFFKASFDKANRLSHRSFRGPGIKEGLRILGQIREEINCHVTTDIHEPSQAEHVASVVDLIQIPALLCRQTDLVMEAARTGRPLNIKKGQFIPPQAMEQILQKAEAAGLHRSEIYLTERGAAYGYGDLVLDLRSVPILQSMMPRGVIVDVGHAVQRTASNVESSGGDRQFIPILAMAASGAGADGLFCEVQDNPGGAKCDGQNSLRLADLADLIDRTEAISRISCAPSA